MIADVQESSNLPIAELSDPSQLKLLNDQVLVRIEKPERMNAEKTLWIPETAKRPGFEMFQATVLGIGPGRMVEKGLNAGKRIPMEVAVGERVWLYWAYARMDPATVRNSKGEHWLIVEENSIQGVIYE